MYEIIIFAIVFYLIITNSFIKIQVAEQGVFLIIKKTEYIYDPTTGNYKEELIVKVKRLIDFTNKLPF
tara:strand:+ start:2152 stop:2355 length:204 start_codon:yes stop_codon:yes gene_type:complete